MSSAANDGKQEGKELFAEAPTVRHARREGTSSIIS